LVNLSERIFPKFVKIGWKKITIASANVPEYTKRKSETNKKERENLESTYHSLSRFVFRRGLLLCLLLEGFSLILLERAGRAGPDAAVFYTYARQFLTAALSAFGCALLGSLLTEDMLRFLD